MNKDREIILEFVDMDSVEAVHEMLRKAFGFPDYYGKNWDALYDCLQDFLTDGPCSVELRGFYSMDEAIRLKCAPMLRVLGDIEEEAENMKLVLVS